MYEHFPVRRLWFGAIKLLFKIYSKILPVPNRYFPYRFAGGRIYLNIKESPMMLARAVGLYERNKTKAIRSFLTPGMTFVDIGANKGDFSLIAARIVGDSGRVLAFEPEPNNCEWIKKSIGLNGYPNITLHELALGDKNERAQLYLGYKSGWHSLLPSSPLCNTGTISVSKRTLDSVLEETSNVNVNLMKIDVEVAELEVLRGARQTLTTNRDIVLLVDVHALLGVNPVQVFDCLSELGFSIHEMRQPYHRLTRNNVARREILAKR